MYAIGIDSGTQGTKVLIVDFNGKVLGRGSHPHRMIEGLKPGTSEQDPQTWIDALENALLQASMLQKFCLWEFPASSMDVSLWTTMAFP